MDNSKIHTAWHFRTRHQSLLEQHLIKHAFRKEYNFRESLCPGSTAEAIDPAAPNSILRQYMYWPVHRKLRNLIGFLLARYRCAIRLHTETNSLPLLLYVIHANDCNQ